MKKYLRNFKFLTLALGLMLTASFGSSAFGQTLNDYRSVGGNWGTLASWQRWNGGAWAVPSAGEGYPGQVNSPGLVTILDNDAITLNVNPTNPIGALDIQGGSNATTLTINAGFTLNVTGAVTYGAPTDNTSDKIISLAAATSVLNCGSIAMPDLVTANDNTILNVNDGTVTVSGNITMAANAANENTVDVNLGILRIGGSFSTTGDFSIINGSTIEYNGAAQTVRGTTYSNLILSGSGSKTTTGVTVVDKLTLAGTATVGNAITYSTAILEYNGSAAQTAALNEFPASTSNIDEVIINNAAGVTINTAKTLNGDLTLTAGVLATGTNLTMGTGTPNITVDGGSITGTLQGTNNYDVEYIGASKTTGAELSGSDLTNIVVNLTAGTDVVTLDQNRTPDGDVTLDDGILDLSTFTLARSAAGGTFDITNNSTLRIGGTNSFPANYNTHNISGGGTATVEYAGTTQSVIDAAGGDNFAILILSGSGVKTLAAGIAVDVLLSIQGTATLAGTSPTYSSAILEYKGSAAQNTSNVEFPAAVTVAVIIDNAAGVTLNGAKTLSGNLTLTSGLLTTTTTNLLTLAAGFGTSGASDNSFVNGPMAKTGTTAFTFPVGKAGAGLRTIAIGTPTASSTFRAEFLRANPQTAVGNSYGAGITQISACEYWTLDRTAGGNATVILSWAAASTCNGASYVNNLAALRVARWTGATWENRTNGGTTGNGSVGTLTSNTITVFSPFVVATSSNLNPLPVTFDDVKAFEKGAGVQVEWSNLTEKDVLNYEVERSANGRDFTAISQLASRSNLSDKQSYLSFDGSPLSGTNYYRIKVVEIDGKVIYSKVLKVEIGKNVKGITLYPNPVVGSDISIVFTAVKGQYTLRVVNNAGQQVYTKQIVHPGGSISQSVTLPSALKTGVYNLMISGDNYSENKKFIMQ